MNRFGLIGAAGYIAPRHFEAIKKNKSELILALDPNDSVGAIDKYFPAAEYYRSFEEFEARIEDLQKTPAEKVNWLSICSPNFLHASHIRAGLRHGCNVICEKPLVLARSEVSAIIDLAEEYKCNVYAILQLRLHPEIKKLKEEFYLAKATKNIELTYITSRGPWYLKSWKGNMKMSGGLAANIGVHFFDMLCWIFGPNVLTEVYYINDSTVSGYTRLERANVKWFLSIDSGHLPDDAKAANKSTFRSIKIDNKEIEFSQGFEHLHIESYCEILNGDGVLAQDALEAIDIVATANSAVVSPARRFAHPLLEDV